MKTNQLLRILIIEDNAARIATFQAWKPNDIHFVIATSPGAALGLIKRDRGMVYGSVMLDHDLLEQCASDSDFEFSGTQVATAITENFSYEIPIFIHSMNASKAAAMEAKLMRADFWVTRIPFAMLTENRLLEWLTEVKENWCDLNSL